MTQIAVGGVIYNYQEVGSGIKTPLLILHGWGRSGNEWIELAKVISAWSGRKAYVLDLPGFGGSSLPNVKNIHDYSHLVVDFCSYLKLDRVIIIGHSLGGRVGILLGANEKKLVEKLILVDPAGVKPRSLKRVVFKLLAALFRWVPTSWRNKLTLGLMDEDYRSSPALRQLYRAVVGEDLRKYLSWISCPVSIIWGERDPILPLSLSTTYKNKIRDHQFRVVWGAGHDPHLTHFEQLRAILEEMSE